MAPQAAPGRGGTFPSSHSGGARPSTAPSRGRRWGMVHGSPQLGLFPRVPLPDGALGVGKQPMARPAAASRPAPPPEGASSGGESASRSGDPASGSCCVDADARSTNLRGSRSAEPHAGAAEGEKRDQEAWPRGRPEAGTGTPTEGVASGAAWERYLVARRHVFAAPDAALPSALGSVRAKRGVFGDSRGVFGDSRGVFGDSRGVFGDSRGVFGDSRVPSRGSAVHQASSGQGPGSESGASGAQNCERTGEGQSTQRAHAFEAGGIPEESTSGGADNRESTSGGPDSRESTSGGADNRGEGCEEASGPEKRPRGEAPWPARPTTAPAPGAGAERRIRGLVRAWEARSQGLVSGSVRSSISRPAQAPKPGEDPGKGERSEEAQEDPGAGERAAGTPPEERPDAAAPSQGATSPRPSPRPSPRLEAMERMAYLVRSRHPYVPIPPSTADRMAYLGHRKVFPGAGAGPAAGSMQGKPAKGQTKEGLRARASPQSAAEGDVPGSIAGSSSGCGEPLEGKGCEERPLLESSKAGPLGRAPTGAAAGGKPLPALKHVPWALREEPTGPGPFLRWPTGGSLGAPGSAGSEAREEAAAGAPGQAPEKGFPALKHMSWSLGDKEEGDDLASLLRKRLADWTRGAQQAAWLGTAAGAPGDASGQQLPAHEAEPLDDPASALRFQGSPDSAGAAGDSEGTVMCGCEGTAMCVCVCESGDSAGTVMCVCESDNCSHSSEEEEEEPGPGEKGEGAEGDGEEEEAVFHDCLDSDDIITEHSDASSESPTARQEGAKNAQNHQGVAPRGPQALEGAIAAVAEAPLAAESSAGQPQSPLNSGPVHALSPFNGGSVQPLSPLCGGGAGRGQEVQPGLWLPEALHTQHCAPQHRALGAELSKGVPEAASGAGGIAPVPRSRTLDEGVPEAASGAGGIAPVPRSRTLDEGVAQQLPASGKPGTPRATSRRSPSPVPRSRTADSAQAAELQQQLWLHSVDKGIRALSLSAHSQRVLKLWGDARRGRPEGSAPCVREFPETEPASPAPAQEAPRDAPGHAHLICAHLLGPAQDSATGGAIPGASEPGKVRQEALQQGAALGSALRKEDLVCPGTRAEEGAEGEPESTDGERWHDPREESAAVVGRQAQAPAQSHGADPGEALGQVRQRAGDGVGQAASLQDEALAGEETRGEMGGDGRGETRGEEGGAEARAAGREETGPECGAREEAEARHAARVEGQAEVGSAERGPHALHSMWAAPDGATMVDVSARQGAALVQVPGLGVPPSPGDRGRAVEALPVEGRCVSEGGLALPGQVGAPLGAHAEASAEGLVLLLGPFSDEGTAGPGALEGRRRKLRALLAELQDMLQDLPEATGRALSPGAASPSPGQAAASVVAIRRCAEEDYLEVLFRGERVCTFQGGTETWDTPAAGHGHHILMESAVAAVSEFYFSFCGY